MLSLEYLKSFYNFCFVLLSSESIFDNLKFYIINKMSKHLLHIQYYSKLFFSVFNILKHMSAKKVTVFTQITHIKQIKRRKSLILKCTQNGTAAKWNHNMPYKQMVLLPVIKHKSPLYLTVLLWFTALFGTEWRASPNRGHSPNQNFKTYSFTADDRYMPGTSERICYLEFSSDCH